MGDWADMEDRALDYDDGREEEVTCKRCKRTGLTWYETADGWRLYDYIGLRLVPHVCPPQDHSNAFEDES